MNFKKLGLFAAGTLFGTAGIKVLTSKDARKVYTEVTAAALRAKECVMTTVTNVQEGAGDILATPRSSMTSAPPLPRLRSWRMPPRLPLRLRNNRYPRKSRHALAAFLLLLFGGIHI